MKAIGFAYVDEYGFVHVVKGADTAKKYSGDGKIYLYKGEFKGGYPTKDGKRAKLKLPGSLPYGNDADKEFEIPEADGTFMLIS